MSTPQGGAVTPSEDGQDPRSTTEGSPSVGHGPGQTAPWRKYTFGGPRTGPGALVVAILACGLGFAVMTQVRQHEKSGLDNLSQPDLVALLADVNDQSARLGGQLDDLRASKDRLARGGDAAAVADAQKRLDQLSILNGTVAVKGPGIRIEIGSASHHVTAANLLDTVQELRDAGAEAIDVGGHRVIASSWFDDANGVARVEGAALPDDLTITAIGDPHTMSTAMAIPGGVTDTLTQSGARVKVTEDTSLRIASVRPSH